MLTVPNLEKELSCCYPSKICSETKQKRISNISSIKALIELAKSEAKLTYEKTEERLEIYKTSAGEIITIQYPGKESINDDASKIKPYDFRPRIILSNGTIVKDLVFADMWGILENVFNEHPKLVKSLSALFFRLGRMLDHYESEEEYKYEVTNIQNNTIIKSGIRKLKWYKLIIKPEIIESLNYNIPDIVLDDSSSISFEAFIYFFSLILENEDIKYNCINNQSSGRIPTSDSMLLISSYFCKKTTLSVLLQKFVSGKGVCKCTASEIGPSTDNIIEIVDRKNDITNHLNKMSIPFYTDRTITVDHQCMTVPIKINNPKTAFLNQPNKSKEDKLTSKGWTVYDIETASIDKTYYERIISYINAIKP